ncbi:hypothetical protein ACOCJ7_12680 [Knoellia sp. CPCC 206453]|uniref:hypothetical protein n=1 Tax=Knoellia pratensis TaxID=3404796 RepID=UPI003618F24E
MITDIVIVPGAPLLLPEYQGRVAAAPGLLESCVGVVREAVGSAHHVVVVHATDRDPRSTKPAVGLRVADHLLAATHENFDVEHVAVPWDATVEECVIAGHALVGRFHDRWPTGSRSGSAFASTDDAKAPPIAPDGDAKTHPFASDGEAKGSVFASQGEAKAPSGAIPRETPATTLLVVADGSARRTEKAPGHLDERALSVDDAIVGAIRGSGDGSLDRLLDLDVELCADLLVAGRAPLQGLAAAVRASAGSAEGERAAYRVEQLEVSDPFGVLYVVAHLRATS